jgi:hypothetical protein
MRVRDALGADVGHYRNRLHVLKDWTITSQVTQRGTLTIISSYIRIVKNALISAVTLLLLFLVF